MASPQTGIPKGVVNGCPFTRNFFGVPSGRSACSFVELLFCAHASLRKLLLNADWRSQVLGYLGQAAEWIPTVVLTIISPSITLLNPEWISFHFIFHAFDPVCPAARQSYRTWILVTSPHEGDSSRFSTSNPRIASKPFPGLIF